MFFLQKNFSRLLKVAAFLVEFSWHIVFSASVYDLANPQYFNIRYRNNNDFGHLAVGDLNDDGILDLVMSAPGNTLGRMANGTVFVIYGPFDRGPGIVKDLADFSNYNLQFHGDADADGKGFGFGTALLITDINNDGIDDLIVGAAAASVGTSTFEGAIYIFYGPLPMGAGLSIDTRDASTYNVRINGSVPSEGIGTAMTSGDLNSDGVEDLVIQSPSLSTGGRIENGAVYILYGPFPGGTGNVLNVANFNVRLDGAEGKVPPFVMLPPVFGNVLIVGDWNGDGKNDLSIGSEFAESWFGRVYVIYGPFPSGTGNVFDMANPANYNLRFSGDLGGDRLGSMMENADINNDGQDDLLLSAQQADIGVQEKGAVYFLYGPLPDAVGSNRKIGTEYNVRLEGAFGTEFFADAPFFGASFSTADFNNDGALDIAISAPNENFPPPYANGGVYVKYGPFPAGVGNRIPFYPEGDDLRYVSSEEGGLPVYRVINGDLYNDGYPELIIGLGEVFILNHPPPPPPTPTPQFPSNDASQIFLLKNVVRHPEDGPLPIRAKLGRTAKASIRVYNSAGEWVRTLLDGEMKQGQEVSLTWDLKNERGDLVGSGVYMVVLESPAAKRVARVIVVK